jgi:hypothetical protein
MRNLKDELRTCVDDLVNELSDLVRRATVQEIVEALENAKGHAPARRPGPPAEVAKAREEHKVAGRKPGRPAKTPMVAPRVGQQRAPELLAQLMERVRSHIKAHPGQGMAPISTSLGTSKKELKLPIRKLVDEKKITSTGKKRGTRYFPK